MNIFFKNKNNSKINPSRQETLASIKSKTDSLTFDTQQGTSNLNLNVITESPVYSKKIIGVNINPATKETLDQIRTKTASLQFDESYGLKIAGSTITIDPTVNIKGKAASTNANAATSEKVELLRRMVKLMESQSNVDLNNNQRVTVDGFVGVTTGTGLSTGVNVPTFTVASDSSTGAVTGLTTGMTTFAGWNGQIFHDIAHNTFAKGIRRKLIFN